MITRSFGSTITQAFSSGAFPAWAKDFSILKPSTRAPLVAAETWRNSRRVVMAVSSGLGRLLRRGVDRLADARIAAAAADVGHRLVDVLVGRLRLAPQQRH